MTNGFVVIRRIKGAALLGTVLGVVTLLAGCTPEAPIFARLHDGTVQFLVCRDVDAEGLKVEIAPRGTVDYRMVWELSGDLPARAGDRFIYGESVAGATVEVEPQAFTLEDHAISVMIGKGISDNTGPYLNAVFGGSELRESSWTSERGARVDDPC